MTKKKIIAIVSAAVALLLVAGIGVAAYAFGKQQAETKNNINVPGIITNVDKGWGSLDLTNPNAEYNIVFDQNGIYFATDITTTTDDTYCDVATAYTESNIYLTWTTDGAQPDTDNVDCFVTVYIPKISCSIMGTTYNLSQFITFNESATGTAPVSADPLTITDDDENDTVYEGKTYQMKLSLSVGSEVGLYCTDGNDFGEGTTLDLALNLNGTGSNGIIVYNNALEDVTSYNMFNSILNDYNVNIIIKVELKSKNASSDTSATA